MHQFNQSTTMNRDFLIGSAQLNKAFESKKSCASGGGITRRSFIKRAGGATVATLVLWHLPSQNAHAACPNQCNAGNHSSHCHWVKKIAVLFDGTIQHNQIQNRGNSTKTGRIFTGTMSITHRHCDEQTDRETTLGVATGGYSMHSMITHPDDSACPAGNFTCKTSGTGTELNGYWISVPGSTGRSDIVVHLAEEVDDEEYEGDKGSSGCIVLQSEEDWETFQELVQLNHKMTSKCVHAPPDPIPFSVTYDPDSPVGNEPGE
jgi:hypothetical protein